MQFIRNILIVGENIDFHTQLKNLLIQSSKKINVETIDDKAALAQKLADKMVNVVFLNVKEASECLYMFRLLNMYKQKTNKELVTFFTSESFETFQAVINKFELEDVTVLPWPVDFTDLSNQILKKVFPREAGRVDIVNKPKSALDIDLEFINVFIESSKNVLREMGEVGDIQHGKPVFKDKMTDPLEMGVASKIMISSDYFKGSFYVIFPSKTFLTLYEKVVCDHYEVINDENRDFAGELANIIYGHSKKVFSESGLNLDMAIPSVHRAAQIESELVVVIPFKSSIGNFYIAVAPGEL